MFFYSQLPLTFLRPLNGSDWPLHMMMPMPNYFLDKSINAVLKKFFADRKLKLVDFKLEFGRHNGEILLGDEIRPDTCRLWDLETNEKLDQDRFRFDLGGVEDAYSEVQRRVLELD